MARRREAGERLIDLTESNPTQVGLRPADERILAALAAPRALSYEPHPRGLLEARRAVAAYYAERGEVVDPEKVWLTASTSEAYSFLAKLLADPGDEILVPRPSYPLLDFLCMLEGVELGSYSLSYGGAQGWHVDVQSLRAAITDRTRAVVIVNPNNPTGSYVKAQELDDMIELCEKRSIAIVCDEVFYDYRLDEAPATASLFRRCGTLVFILSGISKVLGLPQMKLGWIVVNGPEHLLHDAESYLDLITDTYLSVATPVQLALDEWMPNRRVLQQNIRGRILGNLAYLRSIESTTPCVVLKLEGGWYAVLRRDGERSDEETVLELLDRDGVIVHPGYFFDFPGEGFLVLSLLPREEDFREGTGLLTARLRNG
ncbi:MAG: pyridoxal phosphate-dependent aminotransferase [Acidobacteriota bacterium]